MRTVNPFMSRNDFVFADEFKKTTTYITQDDRLQLLLTVFENMKIAADLKLGNAVSAVEKNSRVSTYLLFAGTMVNGKY